ncbi:FRG domain-containing protein [Mesorhizobium sp. LSHC412B00]|uniref:FRG domain-containing protein n=1 Tax=Mesorhizobium sp. LSHC412B00 TaxID=1287285 RepID=UPI0012EB1D41|nr:FRG domain-containing protein [Mesorhizobium sp. LSHC412B00]
MKLPIGKEMPGNFFQFDVASVAEAISLAERFRAAGRYRYFRGQRNAKWRMQSSFARRTKKEKEEEIRKLDAFYSWVRHSPELLPYLKDDESIVATAQHHEIAATIFIDFSTEPTVAAWFATDNAIVGEYGAIFMVNPDDVSSVFKSMTESGIVMRFVQPDIANLWRLQAQHGLFLHTQTDVDGIWPFDRIVFNQTSVIPTIERRRIYPDRQSHLEQMIDQYRLLAERQENFRDLADYGVRRGAIYVRIEDPPDLTPSDLVVPKLPAVLLKTPDERWPLMDIDSAPPVLSPSELRTGGKPLREVVNMRRSSADLVTVEPDFTRHEGDSFQALLNRLWTGMRPHPYTGNQITRAVSKFACLYPAFQKFDLGKGFGLDELADSLVDDAIEIEMAIIGGGSTRAYVASGSLWQTLTEAGRDLLGFSQNPGREALMVALDPYSGGSLRLYDKRALVDLFSDQIVPWQIVVERSVAAYWPTHIATLGRP